MESIQLAGAVCRIVAHRAYKKIFNVKDRPPRPVYSLIAVGLGGVGKSTLLALGAGEEIESIEPTRGFGIKAIQREEVVLNVKELGGDPSIRPYWSRYFNEDVDGIVVVVDSSADEARWAEAADMIRDVLAHGDLKELSVLVLANKQDLDGALKCDEVAQKLNLGEVAAGRSYLVEACSKESAESVQAALDKLVPELPEIVYGDGPDAKEDTE